MKSAPVIAFDYRPSRLLLGCLTAGLLLCVVAIALSGFSVAVRFALAAVAILFAAIRLRGFVHASPSRVAWHGDRNWRLRDASGIETTTQMQTGRARGAWIVVNLRDTRGVRTHLVLGPDNTSDETRRQVRVRLARMSDRNE